MFTEFCSSHDMTNRAKLMKKAALQLRAAAPGDCDAACPAQQVQQLRGSSSAVLRRPPAPAAERQAGSRRLRADPARHEGAQGSSTAGDEPRPCKTSIMVSAMALNNDSNRSPTATTYLTDTHHVDRLLSTPVGLEPCSL